jgi:hypothetical protein
VKNVSTARRRAAFGSFWVKKRTQAQAMKSQQTTVAAHAPTTPPGIL